MFRFGPPARAVPVSGENMTHQGPRLYGRRQGKKLRPGRRALVDRLLPELAIDLTAFETSAGTSGENKSLAPQPLPQLDPRGLFDPDIKAIWLEIGFGAGEHLHALAKAHPNIGFIGCDPFYEGIGKFLTAVDPDRLGNIRLFCGDARELMPLLPDGCLDRAFLLFPDPWQKKRHHKRRFINPETVNQLARLLRPGAEWRLATDIMDYADWMLRHLCDHPDFQWCVQGSQDWHHRPDNWPATRYEAKALEAGRKPVYLRFCRRSSTDLEAGA